MPFEEKSAQKTTPIKKPKKGKQWASLWIVTYKPLFTFDYNDLEVKTYYNYSTIGDKVINNQVFVKNGVLEMINGGSNSYKQSIIIDSYNDKNYFVMLSKDGNIFIMLKL